MIEVIGPDSFMDTGIGQWENPELRPGEYRIHVQLNGYSSEFRTVFVHEDDTQVESIQLYPTGSLSIVGLPEGAQVDIKGPGGMAETRGLPVLIEEAAAGEYSVLVSRQGYRTWQRQFPLAPGENKELQVSLERSTSGPEGENQNGAKPGNEVFHPQADGPAEEEKKEIASSVADGRIGGGNYGFGFRAGFLTIGWEHFYWTLAGVGMMINPDDFYVSVDTTMGFPLYINENHHMRFGILGGFLGDTNTDDTTDPDAEAEPSKNTGTVGVEIVYSYRVLLIGAQLNLQPWAGDDINHKWMAGGYLGLQWRLK